MANTFNHNDKVVITDGGSVGIGTTSPSYKLDVYGSARIGGSNGDVDLVIEADADNSGENDNPRLILKQDGGLVNGIIGLNGDANNAFTGALSNGMYISAYDALQLRGGSGGIVTIDGNGNVGINTTSPSKKLHVLGQTRFDSYSTSDPDTISIGNYPAAHTFTYYNEANGMFIVGGQGSYTGTTLTIGQETGASSTFNHFRVIADTNGTPATQFVIRGDGKVGIGNGSPSYTLDVSGTQRVTGNVVFEGQISFPGVNGNNFVVDTDAQRIVWEHQRNGTRKMVFYHETDADTFNFSFASGNNLQINGNRIVTANELGTAAASAATDFVAVSGDTMSGDLNMGSNDIKSVNSIVLNNVEGSSFGTVNGTLIFDENFYGDTEYGTAWAGGNGGGLAIYGEDGWNRMLSDKNAQWFLGTAAFSRSDDFVAVTGDTMSGNLTISNSSPDLFFETGATHYNWMVAAQENVNAGFEISVGSQDADSSNDTWSPKLVILQSGNVGIGTTSPSYRLHVASADDSVVLIESNGTDATDDARLELKTTNGTFAIQNDRSLGTSGALTFAGNTSNNLLIDHNSGNVGIGTTSPASKLQVNVGTDQNVAINSTGGVARISAYDDAVANSVPLIINGSNLRFTNNTSEAVRITGGNVGIGTTSPQKKLDVRGGYFMTNDGSGKESAFVQGGTGYAYFGNLNAGPAAFGNSENWTTLVADGGNVGIGTTSPDEKLHVVGAIKTSRTTGATENLFFYSQQTAKWGSSTYPGIIESVGNNSFVIGSSQNIPLHLTRSGAIALTIGTGGNVGIGTTSPSYKLQVNGTAYINETLYVNGETTFDGTSNFNTNIVNASAPYASGDEYIKITNPNDNSGTLMVANNGNTWLNADGGKDLWLNWYSLNSASSKADLRVGDGYGGTLMSVIGSSGNVGIGTTSPNAKLEVVGTTYLRDTVFTDTIRPYTADQLTLLNAGNNYVYVNGKMGIGTASPSYKLDVSGDIRATGAVISGGQQLVIPAVGRFLFDSTTDYNTATEGSIAISTEGAIQGGDNTVYTINERDITFNEGGFYKISVYITYTSTTQRANPGIRLKKNNTDYISPWGLSGYLRYASGHDEASNFVDTIAYFDANDYVEVYTKAFAASGTCTDDGSGSHILIERIAM